MQVSASPIQSTPIAQSRVSLTICRLYNKLYHWMEKQQRKKYFIFLMTGEDGQAQYSPRLQKEFCKKVMVQHRCIGTES